MDIHLQSSRLLLGFRLFVFALALCALLICELQPIWKTLLAAMLGLQLIHDMLLRDEVCRLQISTRDDIDTLDETESQITVDLRSRRRLALTLSSCYCLWWIQILYLSAARRSAVVVILPDSCPAEKRRQLRQYLYRR